MQRILIPKWIYIPSASEGETQKYEKFYDIPRNTLDYITLGPSTSFYSINPIEIYAESGLKGYNLGSTVQGIKLSYYWLKEAIKYQNPKYVLLDPIALFYEYEYGITKNSSSVISKALTNMRFSFNKVKASIDCQTSEKSAIEYLVPMLAFHVRWSELSKKDFMERKYDYFLNGSFITFIKENYTDIVDKNKYDYIRYDFNSEYEDRQVISEENKKVFEDIYNLCNKNNMQLILYLAPSTYRTDTYYQQIEDIADTYNLELLALKNAEIEFDWKLDTPDTGRHVNYWGNCKYSNYVSEYLIGLENGYKNKIDEQIWKQNLEYFQAFEEEHLITSEQKTYGYLQSILFNKENYTIIISVSDEACGAWNEVLDYYLKRMGLVSEFNSFHIQQSYIAIVSEGVVLFEEWEAAPMRFEDNLTIAKENISLDIISGGYVYGDIASIKINNVDYAVNSRGLNIVVIDNDTGQVESSVAIDTHVTEPTITVKNLTEEENLWKDISDTVQVIEDGIYMIHPLHVKEETLDICAGMQEDKVNCQLWTTTGEIPQQFKLEYIGNGLYTIEAVCSGKYLTACNYGNTNGTNVVQDSYTGLANQKWFIYETAEEGYTIKNLYNGLVMDVSGTVSAPGVNIQLYEGNDGDWQKFSFVSLPHEKLSTHKYNIDVYNDDRDIVIDRVAFDTCLEEHTVIRKQRRSKNTTK